MPYPHPSNPVYLFAVERDGLEYIILCSNFFSMAMYLPFINIMIIFFSHFPILLYTVYFTKSTGYQNDDSQKTKRFTNSVTVSAHLSVLIYACYQILHQQIQTYMLTYTSTPMPKSTLNSKPTFSTPSYTQISTIATKLWHILIKSFRLFKSI